MFFRRSYQKEIMDDFSIVDDRIEKAIKELKTINKYLGGNKLSAEGVKKISKKHRLSNITLLDLGGGASDILVNIKGNNKIYNIDINKGICKMGEKSGKVVMINGNVKSIPLKENSVDIVHASLFFHHFNKSEIMRIITESFKVGRYGFVINDLRRNVLAWSGIWLLTRVFSSSEMVKHDGPLSVKRGFVKKEWEEILDEFSFRYEIRRRWAFRWLIIIYLADE